MKTFVRKWGGSAAVRIPAATLAAVGLKTGDPVQLRAEPGRIYVEHAVTQQVTLE